MIPITKPGRKSGPKNSNHSKTGQLKLLAILLLTTLLIGCEATTQVRSDSSTTADFSKYQTYGFFDPMGIEAGYNSPVFGEKFRAAIAKEMEARGYRISANPDLIVNVTVQLDEQIKMKAYTAPYMSGAYYERPGGPYYGSAVGVGVGVSTRATRTEDVSVFIDLVDNAAEQLSWQGVAEFEASDKKAQQLEKTINDTVSKVFAQYKHTAGQ
jgi:hypothetical protein